MDGNPHPAAYLDTLGRSYFAVGDYANAVKFQARAVQQEPHSMQLQRQLKLFRAALAERNAKTAEVR